jgi:hypothetical protein
MTPWRNPIPIELQKRGEKMRRIFINAFVSLLVVGVTTALVQAESPHYKKFPTCVVSDTTVTCTGAISGLGNGNVIVTVAFTQADGSTATTLCTNKGGTTAPGQNPALPVSVTGSQLLSRVKNGNVTFSVTTQPPADPTSEQAGCANSNWTAAIDTVTFHGGTLTVAQEQVQGSGQFFTLAQLTITPLFP